MVNRLITPSSVYTLLIFLVSIGLLLFCDNFNVINFANSVLHIARESFGYFIWALSISLIISQGMIDISLFGLIPLYMTFLQVFTNSTVVIGIFPCESGSALLIYFQMFTLSILIGLLQYFLVRSMPKLSLIISLSLGFIYLGASYIIYDMYFFEFDVIRSIEPYVVTGWKYSHYLIYIIIAIFIIFLKFSRFGTRLQIASTNPESARFSKLNINFYLLICYITSSVILMVGIFYKYIILQSGTWDLRSGQGEELLVVSLVVLSGSSLNGGKVNVVSIFGSAFLIITLRRFLNLMENSSDQYFFYFGLILLCGTIIKSFSIRRREATQ